MTPVIAAAAPEVFGARHLALLGLAAALAVVVVVAARRLRGRDAERPVTTTCGWVLLVASLAWMGWWMLPENWDIGRSLPLHFSDVLRLIAAVALIWRARWAVAITYYWGLTLNTQALLSPHPSQLRLSPVEFPFYWGLHITVLLVAIGLIWGLGYRPQWRDFRLAFGAVLLWAALVMGINALIGTNYGFLNDHPPGASILDLLGPWPIFIFWEIVLVAAVWALMTWPWTRQRRGAGGVRNR
ncbi:TIGR02206 family membrane protein [Nesterenkonia xinjiangensis]|uniref:Putative integral membrane protein (TIGR02206 family) n=1 Tax=Nesterenkonia xinjiangensis TaxID=225327 RepID=A0A7Z0GKB1_9MICC|nr:putative integral membrane protein (TIGR02206 family) [Nesterenkonia xinjiangensis]